MAKRIKDNWSENGEDNSPELPHSREVQDVNGDSALLLRGNKEVSAKDTTDSVPADSQRQFPCLDSSSEHLIDDTRPFTQEIQCESVAIEDKQSSVSVTNIETEVVQHHDECDGSKDFIVTLHEPACHWSANTENMSLELKRNVPGEASPTCKFAWRHVPDKPPHAGYLTVVDGCYCIVLNIENSPNYLTLESKPTGDERSIVYMCKADNYPGQVYFYFKFKQKCYLYYPISASTEPELKLDVIPQKEDPVKTLAKQWLWYTGDHCT